MILNYLIDERLIKKFFCKIIVCEIKSLIKNTFVNKSFVFLKKKTASLQLLKIIKILKLNKTLYDLKIFFIYNCGFITAC